MKIDKRRFFPLVLFIGLVLAVVSFNLNVIQALVDNVYEVFSHNFSWIFITANLCAFIFSLWIVWGPYGKIRLGGSEAKPAYGRLSWIAMMFTTSCSAGLIVFGFIETIIYSSEPPFQIEPFSVQAYEYAEMYTHYHWGINAWTLYVPATIAIGYMLYNCGEKRMSMSTACKPILGKYSNGIPGCVIDIFGTFGAVVAPVTSMGLGMPLLTLLLQNIFDIPDQYISVIQILILVTLVLAFGTSVCLGLEKGIKNLSNINVMTAFLFMIYVGALTGGFTVLKSEINTLGLYIANFIRMATYTDPYGDGTFVQKWTVWYWAWLIVYMPLMGVFNARISKGRTLREIVVGQMIWCSLGCWVAMMTLGNYAMKLQQSGTVDIARVLRLEGQPEAILAIVNSMPFPKLTMAVVALLCFIFMATSVDSSSFVAAETTMIHKDGEEQPSRWCRVFWVVVTCIITFVLLKINGFSAVQVLAILSGLPLAVLMFAVVISAIKMLHANEP